MKSNSIKIPGNFHLPFHVNEFSFIEWFESQRFKNYFDDSISTFYILKILNIKLFPAKTRLLILSKIGNVLPELTNNLVSDFISQSFPLQDRSAYCSELVSGLYDELSKGYHLLTLSDEFSKSDAMGNRERILIIYDGLNALNNALIHFSLSYSPVETGFWQRTYDFFLLAKYLGLTKNKVNSKGDCIENIFKGILAFYLSNPSQFNPEELLIISKIISHYSEYNGLIMPSSEKKFKRLPAIIMNEDNPPKYSDVSQIYEDYVFYIATANLAAQLLEFNAVKNSENNIQNSLSRASLLRLVRSLSLNSKRKFERKESDKYCSVIIGIFELCKYFSPKDVKSKSYALKIESDEDFMARDEGFFIDKRVKELNFFSQPGKNKRHEILDKDRVYAHNENPASKQKLNIWSSDLDIVSADNKNEKHLNKVVDISKTGLGILLIEPKNKLRIMSLIGVFDGNYSILGIGVVRRITYVDSLMKIGVELLATEVLYIFACSLLIDEDDKVEGIMFSSRNEKDAVEIIILPVLKFSIDQTIFITIGRNFEKKYYKVQAVLNKTTDYFHYKLAPSNRY